MRSAFALRIFSGKNILFVVPKRLRAFQNYFFTGGVVRDNGICSAVFCESMALWESTASLRPHPALRATRSPLGELSRSD